MNNSGDQYPVLLLFLTNLINPDKMEKKFGLVKRGDLYLLRKLTYPHFKAYVDLKKNVPEIKELTFLERCSASEMAEAIKESSTYLDTVNTEEYQMQEYISRNRS